MDVSAEDASAWRGNLGAGLAHGQGGAEAGLGQRRRLDGLGRRQRLDGRAEVAPGWPGGGGTRHLVRRSVLTTNGER